LKISQLSSSRKYGGGEALPKVIRSEIKRHPDRRQGDSKKKGKWLKRAKSMVRGGGKEKEDWLFKRNHRGGEELERVTDKAKGDFVSKKKRQVTVEMNQTMKGDPIPR